MSNYKQYADCNFYFSHATSDGRKDDNGYTDHRTLDRDVIADVSLEGHPNEDEIYQMMLDTYRPEDLPSNGSNEGYIKGKLTHCPDTRDLAEQAGHPVNQWDSMMLAYQANIRQIRRWKYGFNPLTKHQVAFNTKLRKARSKMKASPAYAKKLLNRWTLLKMCNSALG